jgi:DNA repair exonuclease SbcCD nuclease subunit
LDSPLKSLALRDPALAELVGNATRAALVNIVELCLGEQVDALLIAGDLYDGEQTSMKTARFLAAQMGRLHEAGIRVFIIRGNHDAMSRITAELTLPESVTIFGGRADAVAIAARGGGPDMAIHGLSFAKPHAPESLLAKYKAPVAGAVNIALMHTSLGGAEGHDNYAPCKIVDLHSSGIDYWGLGHVHVRSVVHSPSVVVMPGMPQGRDINEAGAKSVTLVTVGDDRSIHIEEHVTSVAQFERVEIDLTGVSDWRDMVGVVERALGVARDKAVSPHLVARLKLTGATELAWRLRREPELLNAEAESRAGSMGNCWIERIDVACLAPTQPGGDAADPLLDLRLLMEAEVRESSAFRSEVGEIADELRLQLPSECRAMLGLDEAAFERELGELMREGTEDVLAKLHARAAEQA